MSDQKDESLTLDLAKLTWVGWLLLIATLGVFVFLVVVTPLPQQGAPGRRVPRSGLNTLVIMFELFAAILFFAGVNWLLNRVGLSVYRREAPKD